MSTEISSIEYAAVPQNRGIQTSARKSLRWIALISLLITAGVWGPSIVSQIWFLHAQRQCLSFSLSPTTIVYANDPQDAKPLFDSGCPSVANVIGSVFTPAVLPNGELIPSSAGHAPSLLKNVDEATIGGYANFAGAMRKDSIANAPTRTCAFLHAVSNRTGAERLVAVFFIERENPVTFPPTDPDHHLEIDALVWKAAGWQLDDRLTPLSLTTLSLSKLDHHRVRVFAGQLDPQDQSHFTITYDIDRKPGTIDVNLNAADHIQFQTRSGPATSQPLASDTQH
jgi:hypothetical protein